MPTKSLVMAQVGPDGAGGLPDAAMRAVASRGSTECGEDCASDHLNCCWN